MLQTLLQVITPKPQPEATLNLAPGFKAPGTRLPPEKGRASSAPLDQIARRVWDFRALYRAYWGHKSKPSETCSNTHLPNTPTHKLCNN